MRTGEKIKTERINCNYSFKDFAAKLNISTTALESLENYGKIIHNKTMYKTICSLLGFNYKLFMLQIRIEESEAEIKRHINLIKYLKNEIKKEENNA